MTSEYKIKSDDYWFKVVGMLQHNWALIDEMPDGSAFVFFFAGDDRPFVNPRPSAGFDEMNFADVSEATLGLLRNGFKRWVDFTADPRNEGWADRCCPPDKPEVRYEFPSMCSNQGIYSSGRYWK